MFNNFNLSDEEILEIIKDYKPLLVSKSRINHNLDEDLFQEITVNIWKELSKNRKK